MWRGAYSIDNKQGNIVTLFLGEGFLYTMGNNFHGRLGLGDASVTHSSVPCLVEFLLQERISKVSCGFSHTVAVTGSEM